VRPTPEPVPLDEHEIALALLTDVSRRLRMYTGSGSPEWVHEVISLRPIELANLETVLQYADSPYFKGHSERVRAICQQALEKLPKRETDCEDPEALRDVPLWATWQEYGVRGAHLWEWTRTGSLWKDSETQETDNE